MNATKDIIRECVMEKRCSPIVLINALSANFVADTTLDARDMVIDKIGKNLHTRGILMLSISIFDINSRYILLLSHGNFFPSYKANS